MERSRALHIPAALTTRTKNHEVTYVFYLRSVTLLLPKPKPVRPDQAILIEVFGFSLAQKILSSSSRVLFLSLVKTSFSITILLSQLASNRLRNIVFSNLL